jgi:hypothetical protein
MKRSGWSLILAGVIGALFFWLTDPHYGLWQPTDELIIERANEALVGSIIGIVCCATVFAVGVWLLTRRTL